MTMTRDCSARPGWCRAGRESTIAPSRQEQHREERMKVTKLETLRCGAGWRNYNFLKLSTDEGLVGWSAFDEGFGSPGVGTVIAQLAGRVVGRPVASDEQIHAELYCATRPAEAACQGQGARRALLRAPRRQGARSHPSLLVALRHLAHQSSEFLQ